MKTLPIAAAVALVAVACAHADTTMTYTGFMSKEPSTVWTSGTKQRKELVVPMMGKQVMITRVDKGVEWTLNTKKKTYTETPIALPYTPGQKSYEKEGNDPQTDGEEGIENCTAEMKKLSAPRTIAGLSAQGYRIGCKENPKEGMTVWQAASTPDTKKADQDLKAFGTAYSKAQFSNYPAKERAEMEKGVSLWGNLISALPETMGVEKLPQGMWVSTEVESADAGKQSIYELASLSTNAIPASQFEIPAGYKKVEAKKSPFGGMGDMNLQDAIQNLKDMQQE